jgi:hypothetical protein
MYSELPKKKISRSFGKQLDGHSSKSFRVVYREKDTFFQAKKHDFAHEFDFD